MIQKAGNDSRVILMRGSSAWSTSISASSRSGLGPGGNTSGRAKTVISALGRKMEDSMNTQIPASAQSSDLQSRIAICFALALLRFFCMLLLASSPNGGFTATHNFFESRSARWRNGSRSTIHASASMRRRGCRMTEATCLSSRARPYPKH